MSNITNNNQGVSLEEDTNNIEATDNSLMYEWLDPYVHVDYFIDPFDFEAINKLRGKLEKLTKLKKDMAQWRKSITNVKHILL